MNLIFNLIFYSALVVSFLIVFWFSQKIANIFIKKIFSANKASEKKWINPLQKGISHILLSGFFLFLFHPKGWLLIHPLSAQSNIFGQSVIFPILYQIFYVWFIFGLIFIAKSFTPIFTHWVQKTLMVDHQKEHHHLFLFLEKTLNSLVFIFGGLLILQNLGFNITSVLAGLGIGGIAVALAAKDTLSNIFGSIVIAFDKPFIVGDWIQFDQTEGVVQRIGFRSTQIKTFYDSVISIPNYIIANAKIDNMGKRKARRTRFTLGINYSTPPEKIQKFIDGIKKIIESHKKTKKNYYQVSFSGYADSSLNIFVNFFLNVTDWNDELNEKQAIFLEILKLAHQIKVEFAFPSQSIYIEKSQPHSSV